MGLGGAGLRELDYKMSSVFLVEPGRSIFLF